jgi:hypothetical protein
VPTAQQALPALPFTASSHEHVELAATLTVTPTTAVQQLNPIDIPASGYFRSLFIEVVAAGGAGGTLAADAPWNIISSLALKDVNGSHIISPIDGYALYWRTSSGASTSTTTPRMSRGFRGPRRTPDSASACPSKSSPVTRSAHSPTRTVRRTTSSNWQSTTSPAWRPWRSPPRPCSPSACGTKGGPFPPHSQCGASRKHRCRRFSARVSTSTPCPVRSSSARTTPPSTAWET